VSPTLGCLLVLRIRKHPKVEPFHGCLRRNILIIASPVDF
jgi:hypothetical protein